MCVSYAQIYFIILGPEADSQNTIKYVVTKSDKIASCEFWKIFVMRKCHRNSFFIRLFCVNTDFQMICAMIKKIMKKVVKKFCEYASWDQCCKTYFVHSLRIFVLRVFVRLGGKVCSDKHTNCKVL